MNQTQSPIIKYPKPLETLRTHVRYDFTPADMTWADCLQLVCLWFLLHIQKENTHGWLVDLVSVNIHSCHIILFSPTILLFPCTLIDLQLSVVVLRFNMCTKFALLFSLLLITNHLHNTPLTFPLGLVTNRTSCQLIAVLLGELSAVTEVRIYKFLTRRFYLFGTLPAHYTQGSHHCWQIDRSTIWQYLNHL